MTDSSTQILSYKYRLYPNKSQEAQLERILDVACHVYNDVVNMAQNNHNKGIKWSWVDISRLWRLERNKHQCIAELLPSASVDKLVFTYDFNLKSFWALRKNGHEDAMPPGTVSRQKFQSVWYRAGKGMKLKDSSANVAWLYLWSLPSLIRVHYHRPIPAGWQIKQCIVSRSKRGEWYAAFQCEGTPAHVSSNHAIGIDMGLYSLLALSDGTLTDNPRWYRNDLPERRRLQRKADRQRRASNPDNYNPDGTVKQNAVIWRKSNRLRETERLIRKLDSKITSQRNIWWHTITNWLTDTYGLIAIEDLTPQFMIHNKKLAISAHDAAWSTFVAQLEYKCKLRGVELVKVNPAYTSQMCSGCGEIVKKDLSVRVHRCTCGLEIDRDVNAARNILNLALQGEVQPPHGVTQTDRSNVPCSA